ncbi:MAG: carbohydrate ABC transporter substrate-binding protein [Nitrososphaerota archaeon]|jgi:trehalose transport system substrate-binding protein|nr:carbohydrate ABC transporter substrate-binding protein [Nitrososphaerota archaeon]
MGGKHFRKLHAISRISTIIIIVILVAVAAAAGVYYTSRPSKVTVNFYESLAPSEATFVNTVLIPQFESQNPNIIVKLVNLPTGQVPTEVEALVKGGNVGASLVGVDNLVVGELLYGNDLMNLTSIVSTMEPPGLIPSAVNMINYEKQVFGGTYFIPFRSNVPLVFYSKQALAHAGISAPPAAYSELLNDAAKLSAAGYSGPLMFQGHGGASTATELYQWMVQFGGNPFLLNDTGDVQTFQYLYNLSQYFNPDYIHGYWGSYVGLAKGTYQILDYQWPYVYGLLTNTTLGMNDSTLGVYAGPSGPVNGNHLLGGDVLVIPKGATDLPQVEAFANFLLGSQAQRETLLNLAWVAVNSQAYQNLPANFSAVGTALEEAISSGVFLRNPAPWIAEWNTIADNAWTAIIVNHAPYGEIKSILDNANQQLYNYLVTNYGSSVANQYEQNAFKPISV